MCHGQVLKLHWSTARCLAYVCMVLCEHGCYQKTEPERTPLLRAHSVAVHGCARFPSHYNSPDDLYPSAWAMVLSKCLRALALSILPNTRNDADDRLPNTH